ncbi:MAG: cytidylate kinase-like family protein, partial [Polyangiaceae bacterium]|nr:cytidylate kinase-like family protein [Polyangiaceae bacterium]
GNMPHRIRAQNALSQVEREALRTELLERAHAFHPAPRRARRPVITVSREHGALGSAFAEELAKKLGFRLWDRELPAAIGRAGGIPDPVIRQLDEHPHSRFDETLIDWALGSGLSQTHYFSVLRDVIRSIAHEGSAVIVGRGAGFILPPESTLRVRVVAPYETRVDRIALRRGIPDRDAQREAKRIDHLRGAFTRRLASCDPSDVTLHDLVINTERLPVDVAAEIVAYAYRARFGVSARTHAEVSTPATV